MTGNPLTCKMDNSISIVSVCMGIKRVNVRFYSDVTQFFLNISNDKENSILIVIADKTV